MLYERRQEYDKIIGCYLYDESRHQQVFSYLHKIFCLFPKRKEEFQRQLKQHLEVKLISKFDLLSFIWQIHVLMYLILGFN